MGWHRTALVAVNFFWNTPHDSTAQTAFIQGYTDIATLAVVHAGQVSTAQLKERTRDSFARRILVEQAKGVLAHRERISMRAAYERLLQLANDNGRSITAAAARVIDEATLAASSPDEM